MDTKGTYPKAAGPGAAASLGVTLAVGLAFFTFAGYFADTRFNTGMIFTISGMLAGVLFAIYEIWKVIKITNKILDDERINKTTGKEDK